MEKIKKVTKFDVLLQKFSPLTPQGKSAKNNLTLINDKELLRHIYDETEAAVKFSNENEAAVDKIKWHLKRIPKIPSFDSKVFSAVDIFLFKKFLINTKAVCRSYNFGFNLSDLLEFLDRDNMGEETFYLSSKYDNKLKSIRDEISNVDVLINESKKRTLELAKEKYGLDFDGHDFLLMPSEFASKVNQNELNIESYDGHKIILKPVFSKDYFELLGKRSAKIKQEREIENKVLKTITSHIKQEEKKILQLEKDVTSLDLALARAFLVKELKLTRPEIGEIRSYQIKGGRLLSVEDYCAEQKLKYWALDLETDKQNIMLYGSNMCGKTVVLHTIAFLQLTAQFGFFVPAKVFKAPLFDKIALVTDYDDGQEGLSAFGREIVALNEAVSDKNLRTLILFDEFARTTNSTDAVSLLNGLLEYLIHNANFNALLSTHYDSIARHSEVDFFRMKGIKWQDLERAEIDDKENRINLIQKYIEYVPEKDKSSGFSGEALKIAEILGADMSLINYAKKGLGNG
ncbi:MAG: hypothetical protein AB7U85_08685 [Alphaproteobacteria bacterium]